MKPVLVGESNPLRDEARFALWPGPVNCTGWRLLKMIRSVVPEADERTYVSRFDRRNLLPRWASARWDARAARESAEEMRGELAGRRVVLLGARVRDAFFPDRIDRLPARHCIWKRDGDVLFATLPHASGRCLWYNDESNRLRAARFLARLYIGG